jgi:hypothetical protein
VESVRSAWQRLSVPARVVLVLFWPAGVGWLAMYLIEHAPPTQFRWRNLRPVHLLWAGIAVSVGVIGSLPPLPKDKPENTTAAMILVACVVGLLAYRVKRRRQKLWRETGGRMTETPSASGGPKHRRTPLSDRVDANAARIDFLQTRFDGLSDGLITAMRAGGTPIPKTLADAANPSVTDSQPGRPKLRLVRDDEQAG